MTNDIINYNSLIDEAMHSVVKKSLSYIYNGQLPGNHYFFISFFTHAKDVSISAALLKKYPKEMTIVLQHQFEDLNIRDDKFSITLIFNGIKETLEIPYHAITSFVDPSVKFGLQFRHETIKEKQSTNNDKQPLTKKHKLKTTQHDNVITLDNFRKKKN